jgi:hypothetical protein
MELVREQETARGSFPGPCPIIFTGPTQPDFNQFALSSNTVATAVIVSNPSATESTASAKIYSVQSQEDVLAVTSSDSDAMFLVDGMAVNVLEVLSAIPSGSVIIAKLPSMQDDHMEVERAKLLKQNGVTAILLSESIVGDTEDLEYAEFAISALTKKKSSTFNVSGLTGSANGHFGGVAKTVATKWIRTQRQQRQQSQQ